MSAYESRQCPICLHDFLHPAYGDRVCNTCSRDEQREERRVSDERHS